jgi:hypothetical protein
MKAILVLLALTVSSLAYADGPNDDKCNQPQYISGIHTKMIQEILNIYQQADPNATFDGFVFTTVWRNPGGADISVVFKQHVNGKTFDMLGQSSVDPNTCAPSYISSVSVTTQP